MGAYNWISTVLDKKNYQNKNICFQRFRCQTSNNTHTQIRSHNMKRAFLRTLWGLGVSEIFLKTLVLSKKGSYAVPEVFVCNKKKSVHKTCEKTKGSNIQKSKKKKNETLLIKRCSGMNGVTNEFFVFSKNTILKKRTQNKRTKKLKRYYCLLLLIIFLFSFCSII